MGQWDHWRPGAFALILLWVSAVAFGQVAGRANPAAAESTRSILNEGLAFLRANELDRARTSFETALARDPTFAEAHYQLGIIAERRRDLSAAASSYGSAVRYAPAMAKAHDRPGSVSRSRPLAIWTARLRISRPRFGSIPPRTMRRTTSAWPCRRKGAATRPSRFSGGLSIRTRPTCRRG